MLACGCPDGLVLHRAIGIMAGAVLPAEDEQFSGFEAA